MEEQIVREVLTITTKNLTTVDKAIGARFNQVAMLALNQSERYLLHGPESARLAITKQFLTSIARLSAADTESQFAAARESVLRMFATQTDVESHLTDAQFEAVASGTHDQNDEE